MRLINVTYFLAYLACLLPGVFTALAPALLAQRAAREGVAGYPTRVQIAFELQMFQWGITAAAILLAVVGLGAWALLRFQELPDPELGDQAAGGPDQTAADERRGTGRRVALLVGATLLWGAATLPLVSLFVPQGSLAAGGGFVVLCVVGAFRLGPAERLRAALWLALIGCVPGLTYVLLGLLS